MGNSNSSLNDKVNEILNEATPVAPAPGAAGVPTLTEAPKNTYVTGSTESPTSSAPLPTGPVTTSPTSVEQSATSAAPVAGISIVSPTSAAPFVSSPSKKSKIHVAAFGFNYKGPADDLNSAVEAALRASPKPSKDLNRAVQEAMLSEAAPQKGGYTYAAEVNSEPQAGGNSTGQIYLDPSLFLSESEQVGGTNEFNPEKFFNDMQKGGQDYLSPGSVVHRGKKVKKTGLDKTFDTSPDTDEDDGFDLDEEGLEQDTDEEEDTEDVKNKVKHLRAMVARSKGKKVVKGKRRHNKRMTETGGASENSVSEYLNTTSSINTSDVKLISMKRK